MKLYSNPMSCSFAAHVALIAARLPFETIWVTLPQATLPDGSPYAAVNPRRQVPALQTADGRVLTETPAILQYVADQAPDSGLAPAWGTFERYRLQEALNYFASEVHKHVLWPLANAAKYPADQDALRRLLLGMFHERLSFMEERLGDCAFYLGDRFTVADAYMGVVLHWVGRHQIPLERWPGLKAYEARLHQVPAIAEGLRINLPKLKEAMAEWAALKAS